VNVLAAAFPEAAPKPSLGVRMAAWAQSLTYDLRILRTLPVEYWMLFQVAWREFVASGPAVDSFHCSARLDGQEPGLPVPIDRYADTARRCPPQRSGGNRLRAIPNLSMSSSRSEL